MLLLTLDVYRWRNSVLVQMAFVENDGEMDGNDWFVWFCTRCIFVCVICSIVKTATLVNKFYISKLRKASWYSTLVLSTLCVAVVASICIVWTMTYPWFFFVVLEKPELKHILCLSLLIIDVPFCFTDFCVSSASYIKFANWNVVFVFVHILATLLVFPIYK